MSDSRITPELRNSLAKVLAESTRRFSEHPGPENLFAYRAGELSGGQEETLREHLSWCRDCTALLLLDPETAVPEKHEGTTDFELFRAWREMEARMREADLLHRLRKKEKWSRVLRFAAAVLVLAPSLLWIRAESTLYRISRPQANTPIANVRRSEVRGPGAEQGASDPIEIRIPAESRVFLLVIPVERGNLDEFEVRILGAGGKELWRTRDLEVDEFETATLTLSRRFLKAGEYQVEISGLENGERVETLVHPVVLTYL